MAALRTVSTIVVALLGTGAAQAATAPCADMASAFGPSPTATKRAMTARDLVELRDIGDSYSAMSGFADRLAVAPDGRRVAFALVRADLASNSYCHAVYVTAVRPGAVPRLVSAGGEQRRRVASLRGYFSDGGATQPTIPMWSPDGTAVAFLRADRGITQAWLAQADGSGSRPLTRVPGGVTAIAWNAAGTALLVATAPGIAAEQAAIDREGRDGWLYDKRVFASYQLRPLVAADQRYVVQAVDLATGAVRAADAAEAARLPNPTGIEMQTPPSAQAADGRRAWVERPDDGLGTSLALVTTDALGRRYDCDADWCREGIYRLWWDPKGPALYVQRREGRGGEMAAFYRWVPGSASPTRLFATSDVVQDCGWAAAGFVCTRENATTPRRIVMIDRSSGRSSAIFDPNPGFASIVLGSVRRLHAVNALGLDAWGDLVLPPNYRKGRPLPLVIVQYKSQGFLRGGTGDEYPIYLLAQRGFAVLSIERPAFVSAALPDAKTASEANTANFKQWADRRSVLSSLLAVLDRAVATGAIDARRIGITGLSDGASTARFAMLNSHRFAAAAISTCCLEPGLVMAVNGPALAEAFQAMGFPAQTRPDSGYWKDFSLALSGARTDTPLLLVLADHEAYSALETFQAMREYRKPIEMVVYPDEYHVKWQPVHKLAVADRAIDWFAFWLQGKEDPNPAKAAHYIRWRALRDARAANAAPQTQ